MVVQDARGVASVAPGLPRAGLLLRVRVRMIASRLDARLAAGEHPSSSPDLTCRSAQLVSTRARHGLAQGLERLWTDPTNRSGVSAAIPQDRRAVSLARPALEQLADALRSRPWIHPRGAALARLLLTDPCGPPYLPAYPEELLDWARLALSALGPAGAPAAGGEVHHVPWPRVSASRGHGAGGMPHGAATRARTASSGPDRVARSRGDF